MSYKGIRSKGANKNKDFDKRIRRIITILNVLDKNKIIDLKDLVGEFNVSLRTLQRDIQLISKCGFPLSTDGDGKYRFLEGFSLKRFELSYEEASLITLLYDISQSLGATFEQSFSKIFQKCFSLEQHSPYFAKLPDSSHKKTDPYTVEQIENAILDCSQLEISYETQKKGIANFIFYPMKLAYYDGFWYLLGTYQNQNTIVKLRLDRIEEAVYLERYFEPIDNLKKMLEESVNIWFSNKKTQTVTLKVDAEVASYFKDKKYFPYQKIAKENKNGDLILEAKATIAEEIIYTVYQWIPHIKIVKPASFQAEADKRVKEYLKRK